MLFIASDHAGYNLKQKLVKMLTKKGVEFEDLGTNSFESVDFPKYAKMLCSKVLENDANKGVLICGTGIGMSISANRIRGIRAALCKDVKTAQLARQHNNANVLVLAGRRGCPCKAKKMLEKFLTTEFLGGKYAERMNEID